MDILIDLIVWIIKASASSRKPPAQRVTPANQQEIDRQKAEVERRIREMQNALAQQTGRAAPVAKQARKVKRTVKQATPPPLPAPPVVLQRWSEPQVGSATPVVTRRDSTATLAQKSYIVPLLLGEILAPPLSLRESGF
jgi:hypothetical protein